MSSHISSWLKALVVAVWFAASLRLAVAQTQDQPAPKRPRPVAGPRQGGTEDGQPQVSGQPQPGPGPSGQPVRRQGRPAQRPTAPFELTPEEQVQVDEVLAAWEKQSAGIRTLKADFTRWEYDEVFGKKDDQGNVIPTESHGILRYAAPDKGLYQVTDEGGEHWVCDGHSIFEYDHAKRQLIERVLPPQLQGKAITDGPLPFLFGAEAAKLKRRYYIRLVTPPQIEGQIWLEGYPRLAVDAANFQRATVILDQEKMLPVALEIIQPNGKNRTAHQFKDQKINDPFAKILGDFSKPKLPRGWTKVVENVPASPAPPPQKTVAPAQPSRQQ